MVQIVLDIRDHATRVLNANYESVDEARAEVFDLLASGARFLPFEDMIVATADITLIEFIEDDTDD